MLFRKKSLKIRSWCLTWSTPPFIRYFRRVFFHPPSVSSERFLLRTAPFLDHFASFLVLQIVGTLLNTLAYTNQYLSTPWERGEGGIDAPSMWILVENVRTMYSPTPEILSSLCMEKLYVGPTTLICHQPPTKILNWIFLHIHILTCHQECVTQTHFLEIEKYLCDPNCERSKKFLFLFLKFFQDYLARRSFDTFLFLQIIPLDRNNGGIGKIAVDLVWYDVRNLVQSC